MFLSYAKLAVPIVSISMLVTISAAAQKVGTAQTKSTNESSTTLHAVPADPEIKRLTDAITMRGEEKPINAKEMSMLGFEENSVPAKGIEVNNPDAERRGIIRFFLGQRTYIVMVRPSMDEKYAWVFVLLENGELDRALQLQKTDEKPLTTTRLSNDIAMPLASAERAFWLHWIESKPAATSTPK